MTDVDGPIAAKVRADLAALITTHPMGESLSACALNLARVLDQEAAGSQVANVHKELRATLAELARMGAPDDDLDAELSAAMGDAPPP